SLAPSSSTRIRTSPSNDQSSRRNPPADVSPETPAFTTSYLNPSASRCFWTSEGTDCSTSRPKPAVRLSPRNTIRGRVDADAAAGADDAGGDGGDVARAGAGSLEEHADTARTAETKRRRSDCNMLRVL